VAELIVIADDLTGAAECAAACASQGFRATVLLYSSGDRIADLPNSDVLAIDANTRLQSAGHAAETTAEVVRRLTTSGAPATGCFIFKKLDSTLRGNFGTEIAAVLRVRSDMTSNADKVSIVLAPALPAQGRTTVGGFQLVHGRALEESDLACSGVGGPRSDIAMALGDAGLSCTLIDLGAVRSGLSVLQNAMAGLAPETDVILCDAETDEDLHAIAEASMILGERTVWAGSAGLAGHLPHAIKMATSGNDVEPGDISPGPTLLVVGSPASLSREQARLLAAMPDVVTVPVAHGSLVDDRTACAMIREGLQSGRDVLVVFDEDQSFGGDEATHLTKALSRAVASCAPILGGLVMTGGETARAILDEIGIRRLRLLGEVESGLPFSIADGWTRPLPVLTKAGGFGSPQTLVRCREFLQRMERASAPSEARSPFVS